MDTEQRNPTQVSHSVIQVRPKYPIKVYYVYKKPHNSNDETFLTIRDWCKELNIDFYPREYDSYKFREDRDEIERLPALHLFEREVRDTTFYPDRRPLQVIEEAYRKFEQKEREEKEKKEAWQRWKDKWKERFLSIGRHKTRMEEYAEEQARFQAREMRRVASDQVIVQVDPPPPMTLSPMARSSRKQVLSSRF
jgi:hypothetical protein